jgi:hypothetical protein
MDERDDKGQTGDGTGEDAAGPAGETDFRALAEDWIAIWQSEITTYLSDPETQAHWTAMMALWGEAAQAMMSAMPPGRGFGAAGHDHRRRPSRPATPPAPAGTDAAPGAAPAATAPDSRNDEVRRLEQRVAELERRLGQRHGATASLSDAGRSPAGPDRRQRRGGRPRS